MKKYFLIFALAILVLAGFSCNGPVEDTQDLTNVNNETNPTTSMPVPAPGNTNVDEMIVNTNTSAEKAGGETKVFDMEAKQWEFVPSTITVNQGDTVIINATSTDVVHGFLIPEYNINVDLPVDETVKIEFVADKKGEFSFRCSVYCGSGHGAMTGTLIVN